MAFTLNRSHIDLIFKRVLPGMLFVKCRDRYDNRSGNAVRWQQKLIKAEGLFLVNPARISIQDPKGCRTIQMPLVYNRVCWGFVWCGCGLFQFWKNVSRGPRDFSGHFLGSREDGRLVFAWFWGPGAREGSFGVTNQKRDILVAV